MKPKLEQRIRTLEETTTSRADVELLAWGRAVTDEELERVIAEAEAVIGQRGGSAGSAGGRPAKALGEVQFYRLLKPIVEAWRAEAAAGSMAE